MAINRHILMNVRMKDIRDIIHTNEDTNIDNIKLNSNSSIMYELIKKFYYDTNILVSNPNKQIYPRLLYLESINYNVPEDQIGIHHHILSGYKHIVDIVDNMIELYNIKEFVENEIYATIMMNQIIEGQNIYSDLILSKRRLVINDIEDLVLRKLEEQKRIIYNNKVRYLMGSKIGPTLDFTESNIKDDIIKVPEKFPLCNSLYDEQYQDTIPENYSDIMKSFFSFVNSSESNELKLPDMDKYTLIGLLKDINFYIDISYNTKNKEIFKDIYINFTSHMHSKHIIEYLKNTNCTDITIEKSKEVR